MYTGSGGEWGWLQRVLGLGRTVWKRVYLGDLALVPVDAAETGEGVLAVDVHGA